MIVEMRSYLFWPGKLSTFISIYEKDGLALQQDILGNLIGYFTKETGELNSTVHLWGYISFEDRIARRRRLAEDPRWSAFLSEIYPLLVSQNSEILTPTTFSPIR